LLGEEVHTPADDVRTEEVLDVVQQDWRDQVMETSADDVV
jgi:hypothetical protein